MSAELFGAALFLISLAGTWLLRVYAMRRNLVDLPGERRSHVVATPRGGGMAIVISLVSAVVAAACLAPWLRSELLVVGGGLVMVAAVGWWDDHRDLSPLVRLVVHLLAAVMLGSQVYAQSGSWLLAGLAVLFTVGLINVWNFMDGINGLAVTQAMLAAIAGLLVLPGPYAWAGWALLLGCLGFLPFNFPRARIFLGDGGSGSLGYLVSAILALCVMHAEVSPWSVLLPISAFLIDAGFTLASRILSGQRWWQPHSQHVYQAMARRFGSHVPVTCAYGVFTVLAVGLFCLIRGAQSGRAAAVTIAWLTAAFVIWLLLRKGLRSN